MSKKKSKVYKKTTVRDKRSFLRSLDIFTEKNSEAFLEDSEFESINEITFFSPLIKLRRLYWIIKKTELTLRDFDFQHKLFSTKEPISISFEDSPYKIGEFKYGSGGIYSKIVSDVRLSDYTFVINEISNLISINRKVNYKIALQNIIEEYTYKYSDDSKEWITYFFNGDDVEEKIKKIELSLSQYNEITSYNKPKAYKLPISSHEKASDRIERLYVESKSYASLAKKIYTQLHRRIKYHEIGFYKVPTSDKYKTDAIPVRFISSYDRMKARIDYLLKREWLLDKHILNALRERMASSYYEDENEADDIISTVSRVFGVDINESIEDDKYQDSIEILKRQYFKYQEIEPYEYELLDDETKSWTYEDAIEYILDLNQYINEFVGEDEEEKTQKQEPLTTIEQEWEDLYNKLLSGILSENLEKNEYYKMCSLAKELSEEYEFLKENKVFLDDGKINLKSKYVQSQKQELIKKIKNLSLDRKYELTTNLISDKKVEYLLLQEAVNNNPFIRALSDFNYKNLYFTG